MPKIRLTELSVKTAKPLATQYMLWDATLPNFGVRVSPGGTKNFTAMLGARRERVSIGRFPIISLAEARVKAKALMAERTLGQHQAKTINFEEAYELFKSQHCARKKARTSHVMYCFVDQRTTQSTRCECSKTNRVIDIAVDRMSNSEIKCSHQSRNFCSQHND